MANKKTTSQITDLRQRKFLFTFLIFLLVVIFLWVVINLFSTQNTLKISTELKDLANPLTPSVDITVLDSLEKKQFYLEGELRSFPIYRIEEEDENDKGKLVEIDFNKNSEDAQLEETQNPQSLSNMDNFNDVSASTIDSVEATEEANL